MNSRDRGTAATEIAFAVTIMLGVVLFVAGAARVTSTNGEVQSAARAAARAAAAGRSSGEAQGLASQAAAAALANSRCIGVSAGAAGYSAGGQVQVTVTCTLPMGSTSAVGFDSSRTVTAVATERVEVLRGD